MTGCRQALGDGNTTRAGTDDDIVVSLVLIDDRAFYRLGRLWGLRLDRFFWFFGSVSFNGLFYFCFRACCDGLFDFACL